MPSESHATTQSSTLMSVLFERYFATSVIPSGRYTDALAAELLLGPRLPSEVTHAAAAAAATEALASVLFNEAPPPTGAARLRQQRRRVTFADEVGLQLARVRLLDADDEGQLGPLRLRSATVGGRYCCNDHSPNGSAAEGSPAIRLSLLQLRRDGSVGAVVAVRDPGERVFARVTQNSWLTYHDVEATRSDASEDGCRRRYYVTLRSPNADKSDAKTPGGLEFCLCLRTSSGADFWDNNFGRNYQLMLVAAGKEAKDPQAP